MAGDFREGFRYNGENIMYEDNIISQKVFCQKSPSPLHVCL